MRALWSGVIQFGLVVLPVKLYSATEEHHVRLRSRRPTARIESAQARWRAITGAHRVPLVRAGARFENGVLVEREEAAA